MKRHSGPKPFLNNDGGSLTRRLAHPGIDRAESSEPSRRSPTDVSTVIDMLETRWARGEHARVEEYLTADLTDDEATALIFHEYCVRIDPRDAQATDAFLSRFPNFRSRLTALLGLRSLMNDGRIGGQHGETDPIEWPEPGDEVGPYCLVRLLGSGSFSRVFLVEDSGLAGRLAVLKVSALHTKEPQLLARLRHPNIIQVLRHEVTNDEQFQLITMPYVGGATLAQMIATMRDPKVGRVRSGRNWLELLDSFTRPEDGDAFENGPTRQILGSRNFATAMCWTFARLADAIELAHQRGIIHGDIKPTNVLIAADGKPLLLDLNLSVDGGTEEFVDRGGTAAYMSPERYSRFRDCEEGKACATRPLSRDELRRSDIYALGLVLWETLTLGVVGRSGTESTLARNTEFSEFDRWNDDRDWARKAIGDPRIPRALRPVLLSCLAFDSQDRYENGRQLATDLDRLASDQPPRYAPGLSYRARLSLWTRRRRIAIALATVALGAVVSIAGVWHSMRTAFREAALNRVLALWSGRVPGIFRFDLVGSWQRDDPSEVAEIAVRVLNQFGALENENWRDRPDFSVLPQSVKFDIELWVLEQTWKYAVVLSQREVPAQRRRALNLLERDARWAALAPIVDQRELLRKALNELHPGPALGTPVRGNSAMEAYLAGLACEPQRARDAREQFKRAARLAPNSFWVNYRIAACSARLGDYRTAIRCLAVCLRLTPNNAALWTQQATCLLRAGYGLEAEEACTRALEIDPEMSEAVRTRAIANASLGVDDRILEDLRHFGWLSGNRGELDRWNLLFVVDYALGRAPRLGQTDLDAEWKSHPTDGNASLAHALRGFIDERQGEWRDALDHYAKALTLNPDHLWARYRRAHLRRWFDPRGALEDYELVIRHPRVEELFGTQPSTMRLMAYFISRHTRAAMREPDASIRTSHRELAISLAEEAVVHARNLPWANMEADMLILRARTLANLSTSSDAAADNVAASLEAAYRSDPDRTEWLISRDRVFTGRLELPSWLPSYDPARWYYPIRRHSTTR